MKGKRVKMTVDDTWARPGWIGVVTEQSNDGQNVRVKWDNGKSLMHQVRNMILLNEEGDPNIAFQIHKFKKKGKIL